MVQKIDPVEFFRPKPDESCVCGSKKIFSLCCGGNDPDRDPPKGMLLQRGFLPEPACNKLISYAIKKESEALKVKEINQKGGISEVEDSLRVAEKITLNEKQKVIDKWVKDIFLKFVNKKFKKKIKSIEAAQLMRYSRGGFYKQHSDSEFFNPELQEWQRILDRDYSLLLYLNDDFEGGCVHFTHFNYTFKPQKGDLLIFPSHHLYLHEAQEVTSGLRYVIVSWATVK